MMKRLYLLVLTVLATACVQVPAPDLPPGTASAPTGLPRATDSVPSTTIAPTPFPDSPPPTSIPLGDGIHWTKHPANPVLDIGREGAWDSALVSQPRVVQTDAGFQMMFVGQYGAREGGALSFNFGYALGRATSADGAAWERYDLNPILAPAPGQFGMLWHSGAGRDHGYFMYVTLGDTLDGRAGLRIYRATSPDGLAWTADADPAIDLGPEGSYDDYDVFAPIVLVEVGLFKMWYNVSDGERSMIAYATSPDGLAWTPSAANPVLDLGPGAAPYYPSVLRMGDGYLMWYGSGEGIALTTSPDGITWTPHERNPVLTPGTAGEWDGGGVSEPSVVFDGRIFHLWYTGTDAEGVERIGYATSP